MPINKKLEDKLDSLHSRKIVSSSEIDHLTEYAEKHNNSNKYPSSKKYSLATTNKVPNKIDELKTYTLTPNQLAVRFLESRIHDHNLKVAIKILKETQECMNESLTLSSKLIKLTEKYNQAFSKLASKHHIEANRIADLTFLKNHPARQVRAIATILKNYQQTSATINKIQGEIKESIIFLEEIINTAKEMTSYVNFLSQAASFLEVIMNRLQMVMKENTLESVARSSSQENESLKNHTTIDNPSPTIDIPSSDSDEFLPEEPHIDHKMAAYVWENNLLEQIDLSKIIEACDHQIDDLDHLINNIDNTSSVSSSLSELTKKEHAWKEELASIKNAQSDQSNESSESEDNNPFTKMG